MPIWLTVLVHALASAVAVLLVMLSFWHLIVRPYLNARVEELIKATNEIEPKVTRGVKAGVSETLRELPEVALDGTVRESTRQFLKFGSGLFENGLSAFLGSASDLERHNQNRDDQTSRE
ncbi:hypothetical protein FWJ25_07255 [Marinobacter salinexigens]|uniref:Uncharacterized protein n=1 Tax=Marinobacter salinexigens TaxID=2919747 RepID=A0A5B0VLE4_9GAMM|nr:hypothetical protein [Marinobacter salinexigens]KAA1175158.1 hypothetical protein FWJ25_07255 [Marinobacter salinexigens]